MRTRRTSEGVLIVHAVTDRLIGQGSLVEILLLDPWKGARSDIQAEYDLAALGEVEGIHGPFCNPPRWMVSYKGKAFGQARRPDSTETAKRESGELGKSADGRLTRM